MVEGIKINERQKEQYIQKGYWTHKSLLDYWLEAVRSYASREYVVDDRGNRYTYGQMDEMAGKIASYLRKAGVTHGDTVAFQIPVWSEFVMISIACLKAGAILHPIAMCYEEEDLVHAMNQTQPKVYFAPVWFHKTDYEARILAVRNRIPSLEHIVLLDNLKEMKNGFIRLREIFAAEKPLEERVKTDGFDVALILGTSGTTGGSKGVMLTHNNIIFSENQFNRELFLTGEDIIFMPAPLNHATGFHHGIIAPMLMGGKVVLQQKFCAPKAMDLMNREKCTYSMGSTPFIYDILKEMKKNGGKLKYLKFYLCGGAPVPEDMVQKAGQYGICLCEVYGSTESVPHMFVHPGEVYKYGGITSGRPIEGVEVRIIDEEGKDTESGVPGEEVSRGANVFVGYVGNQKATDRALDDDGWFHSGDICVEDGAGNFRIIGRKKDMIVRGGENLDSNIINNYMEGCPKVLDHAIIGMPDERLGERICAYAVLEPEVLTMELKELSQYLSSKKVPKRFWPERLEIIDKIPYTASGKVKKYLLQEDLKERMSHE